ncbi:MAG: hypothetical protein QNI84_07880 [Henriciella sp.]|nr:hypothetical protein [Henriciella sp.]
MIRVDMSSPEKYAEEMAYGNRPSGPPGRHFYEKKAAAEQEGAKYLAGLERAGREYEAKKARSRSR